MLLAVMAVIWFTSPAVADAAAKGGQDIYPAMRKEFGYKNFCRIKVVPSYTSISGRGSYVFGYFHITYIKSDTYKVEMDVRDRDNMEMFDIRKNGDALELQYGYRRYPYHSGSRKDIVAEVTVYAPELEEAALSGQSTMTVSGGAFSGNSLNVDLSGASSIKGLSGRWDKVVLGLSGCSCLENCSVESGVLRINASGAVKISGTSSFNASEVNIDLSGAASLKTTSVRAGKINASMAGAPVFTSDRMDAASVMLTMSGSSSFRTSGNMESVSAGLSGAASADFSGTGKTLSLSASGSSALKARNFTVKSAELTVSGASSSALTVTENLETSVTGFATVDYYGHPKEVKSRTDNVRGH